MMGCSWSHTHQNLKKLPWFFCSSYDFVILYIKATLVSICLSVCGDKQGRAGARQGDQGRHRCFQLQTGQGRAGRPGQTPARYFQSQTGQGRAARADTRPLFSVTDRAGQGGQRRHLPIVGHFQLRLHFQAVIF
jgi:hypothetical protein